MMYSYVSLTGFLSFLKFYEEYTLLIGSICIGDSSKDCQKVSFKTNGDVAEDINNAGLGAFIKLIGHIENSNYDKDCVSCGKPYKVYSTDIIIDSFYLL